MAGTLCSRIDCPEPDVGLLHEFENDTDDIPALEVNMEESEKL